MKHITEVFLTTVFCIAAMITGSALFGWVIHKIEIFNPLVNKIEDFELSDLCFAYMHEYAVPENSIIIINCVNDNRDRIASKITKVEKYKPAVLGLDIIFDGLGNKNQGNALIKAINENKNNIVLGSVEASSEENRTFNLPFYQQMQFLNNGDGVFNTGILEVTDPMKTKRNFKPYFTRIDSQTDTSFAIEILKTGGFNEALKKFDSRIKSDNEIIINFRNGMQRKFRYEVYDSIPENANLFENKIILFGALDSLSLLDKHYTPLNIGIGRSYPDMNGVEYQAQIVSMIIHEDYIKSLPYKYVWIFLAMFAMMFLIIYWHNHSKYSMLYFELFFVLILSPAFFLLGCFCLEYLKIKLEPTNFLVPVFFSELIFILYPPFKSFIKKIKLTYKRKN